MIKGIDFKNNLNLRLKGFVHEPKNYDTAIIHLHGFPGNMFKTPLRMCRAMSTLGYLCMRFEFTGTHKSEGKFEDKLMSQEVKDIRYAINFLKKNYSFKKLILIGHSTGAIDAALYAYRDKRIDKLVLMGSVSNLDEAVRYDFTDKQVRNFWLKGFVTYNEPGNWTHRKKINKAFYDEFFKLNIPRDIKKFKKPILIIHGTKDEAIPFDKDPKEIYKLANRPKKLVYIKDADHSFKKKKHWDKLIFEINKFIK